MCYGICNFENHMGDCLVKNFKDIKKEFGYTACLIGGAITCKEEEKLYNELKTSGKLKNMVAKIQLNNIWY